MKKILIVDDAMFMRHTLKIILERNNYEIVGMAEDGAEAVVKCKEPMLKEAIVSGASNFIVKPFKEKKIIDVLDRL